MGGYRESWITIAAKTIVLTVLFYWSYQMISIDRPWTFLDAATLVFHEAGHFIFGFFGRFIHFAGGTIMQILLPSILIFHFYVNDYRLGVQVFLFWLGHNLINISVYAADARARMLPLLGGDNVQHDWWTMLSMLNWLQYDQLIGNLFFAGAILVFSLLLITPRIMMQ